MTPPPPNGRSPGPATPRPPSPAPATAPPSPTSAGLPLGTGLADGSYQATRLHPPPGTTLVLYTDGLIETPATGITAGMARLARTLRTTSRLPLTRACDRLLAALAPRPADDIAILMART